MKQVSAKKIRFFSPIILPTKCPKLKPQLPAVLARMVASGELDGEDALAIPPSRYEAIVGGFASDPLTEESIRIRFG